MIVEWVDGNREPQVKPNPAYPDGIDVDGTEGQIPFCSTSLPYPAKRCGHYLVRCNDCRQTAAVTTAGRPDDPRSFKMKCNVERLKEQIGPTGEFPEGQIDKDDEGGLRIAIGIHKNRRDLLISFGKKVSWIGFPKKEARQFAETILKHVEVLEEIEKE